MNNDDFVLLLAEDDEHDIVAVRRAWQKLGLTSPLRIVKDGEDCLDYLYRRGPYADPPRAPRPALLLLDIHMPRLDGIATLRAIRSDPRFRHLPIVVLSTSGAEDDRARSYAAGANAYLVKPVGFDGLVEALAAINQFWKRVILPETSHDAD